MSRSTRSTVPYLSVAVAAAAALFLTSCSSGTAATGTTGSSSSEAGASSGSSQESNTSGGDAETTVDSSESSAPISDDSAGEPITGGNLTIQISQDPGSLDVNASGNISTGTISKYLFEKLFDLDAQSKPHPVLLKDWSQSDDGLTYTFTLRDGVVFSDGTPLTADDVVASLKYWMANSSYGKPIGEILKDLKVGPDGSIQLSITKRWPVPLIIAASDGATVLKASIVSKLDAKGFDQQQAIGTGPYKLKSWSPGDEIVLERNDKYQSPDGDPSGYVGARHAYLDTITFKVVADQDAIVNGLETGQWDIATTPVADQYDRLAANPDLKVSTTAGGNNDLLFLNNDQGIMSNPKARDGLNLIMDKPALMALTGHEGLTTDTGAWAVPDNSDLYSTAGEDVYQAHDPAKGKELLQEAGFKDGDTLRIITTGEFAQFVTWATELQAQLKAAGVNASVETYDFGTMIDKAKANEWDIMTLFDGGDVVLPQLSIAVTGLMPFLDVTKVPANMQALIDEYAAATTDADAKAIGDKIQALVWQDKPSIVIGQDKSFIAYTARLQGYDHYKLDFWNSWLSK